jgi:hypothetical protein
LIVAKLHALIVVTPVGQDLFSEPSTEGDRERRTGRTHRERERT